MKSSIQIVHGGGWLTHQTVGRPKARLAGFLSILWLPVSICAFFPFWDGRPESLGSLEWLCGAILVLQSMFVLLALLFLRIEQPRAMTEKIPNPDYDIRKLY